MTSDNSQEGADLIPPLLGSPQGHTFESWWEQSGSVYAAAVDAAGGQCWTRDLEERRALWERRYHRPNPPSLPTIKDITSYQKTTADEETSARAETKIKSPIGVASSGLIASQPAEGLVCDGLTA